MNNFSLHCPYRRVKIFVSKMCLLATTTKKKQTLFACVSATLFFTAIALHKNMFFSLESTLKIISHSQANFNDVMNINPGILAKNHFHTNQRLNFRIEMHEFSHFNWFTLFMRGRSALVLKWLLNYQFKKYLKVTNE